MKEISDFISTVGFPIVVCLLMLYQNEKQSESYITIVESLKELIADNTKSINLLISRAKENDERMMNLMKNEGVKLNNENKQETNTTVPSNEQGK